MVGLKSFWIIISTLFVLAACVPQTKQTECGANEAFNASLRTCVPIVGGPSSFINIDSYSPMFTQTRSKDDFSTLTFNITISNPYNQSYTVEWERVFNASPVTICANALSCSFPASYLGLTLGEIGTHIVTAKVKDGNGTVVDTHSFELKINDLPKPVIGVPITPSTYAFDVLPSDPRVQFSLVIRNNGSSILSTDNYRTIWTIQKNGSTIYTESDSFTTFTPTGTNSAYLGTSPTPYFNPGGAAFGVGSYIVRAVVQNDVPGEIVAEQQWSVIVKQPDLANVTTISMPAPGVTTTAHNNVDYNDYPTLSWVYSGTTQPEFCITVDDKDGTYAGDGKAIQVRWYLDSIGGEICQKTTDDTPGTQTICLVDPATNCDGSGLPFDTDLLKFTNTTSTVSQNHKVTARLFDEATTYEFIAADIIAAGGSYPIEWTVLTKPVNTAPTIAFGTTQPTGCANSGSFTKSSCQVTQGTSFNVTFTYSDDFYSALADSDELQWDVVLKRNGSTITSPPTVTSCTKAFGALVGSTTYTCSLTVPHFDANGPLDPSSGSYSIVATAQDSGSPVGGSSQVSQSLTWNLVVAEANSGVSLQAQTLLSAESSITLSGTALQPGVPASYATETQTVVFNARVTDPELDNFRHRVSLCTNNMWTCTTSTPISSWTTVTRSLQTDPDENPTTVAALSYQLPEDLLIGKHNTPIDAVLNDSKPVFFKVEVQDLPQVGSTTSVTTSQIFEINVQNYNPAPVINTATASPAVGSTTKVYSGYPITIDPGTVTDASVPASERNLSYQWYAKTGLGAWTAVQGATARVLKYTPGNIDATIELKLCVGDGTNANPVSSTGTCTASWNIDSEPYAYNLSATGISTGINNEVAVWYDNTNAVPNTEVIYSAYVDAANNILVEKTVKTTSGTITTSNVQTITFHALSVLGTAVSVTNLSITGSDDSVYVAYLASPTSAPTVVRPRIRRINKDFNTGGQPGYKSALAHSAPFGFSYDDYDLDCMTAATCTAVDGGGNASTITLSGPIVAGQQLRINGVTFTAAEPGNGAAEICGSLTCTTQNSAAADLAAKINNSTDPLLQGFTAHVTNTGEVSLFGTFAFDYMDFNGTVGPSLVALAGGMGKIMVSGSKWYLPFINATSSQNYINVLSGNVDEHMLITPPVVSDDLEEIGKVATFDAKLNRSGQLVIAAVSAETGYAGRISMHRYDLAGSPIVPVAVAGTERNDMDVFGTTQFEYVKLATDHTANPYYYVIAREQAGNGGEYHIGRYDPEFDSAVTLLEYLVSAKVSTTDSTSTVMTDALMKNPDIISTPGYDEARIFFHSVGSGVVPYPRVARWKADNTLACGTCFSLSGTYAYQPTANIGISQVATNRTLGSAGSVAGENTRDLAFILMASDVAVTGNYMPQLGIINLQNEVIQSTAVDGTGLFQPPFALD